MRKIKFRAWDVKKKAYFNVLQSLHFDKTIGSTFLSTLDSITLWSPDIIIEQYTGLKDFKGREIYEGDIVHVDESINDYGNTFGEYTGVVVFNNGSFDVKLKDPLYGNKTISLFSEYDDRIKDTKIIGNIHENPELLEATK